MTVSPVVIVPFLFSQAYVRRSTSAFGVTRMLQVKARIQGRISALIQVMRLVYESVKNS